METLQHLLTRCLGELREWRAEHAETLGSDEFYGRVERSLRQLRRVREDEDAARRVIELELLIRDEGPLAEGFMPSLEDLHDAVAHATA
ncbi:MAG: hypothetical protein JRH10_20520 [Deltaproteobacteria bacterium]|nr:hypothetical protein [Deltaproteobacteria bacterium]MBW2448442.1 hypothetical protein [Deltaproteobacteria bacterium]